MMHKRVLRSITMTMKWELYVLSSWCILVNVGNSKKTTNIQCGNLEKMSGIDGFIQEKLEN